MDSLIVTKPSSSNGRKRRRFWLAYAGVCLVSWLLFVLAGLFVLRFIYMGKA